MHAAAINLRGGVSPRSIRLRGQSIIEYVLIIAVIGLVIVFAGPGVAGAIRNQFNLVGNTVNNGTTGGVESAGMVSFLAHVEAAPDVETGVVVHDGHHPSIETTVLGVVMRQLPAPTLGRDLC